MNRPLDFIIGLGDVEGDLLDLREQMDMTPLQTYTIALARAGIKGDHKEPFPSATRSGFDQRGYLLRTERRLATLAFAQLVLHRLDGRAWVVGNNMIAPGALEDRRAEGDIGVQRDR